MSNMLPFTMLEGIGITFYLLAEYCVVQINAPVNEYGVFTFPLWDLELNLL